MTEAEKVLTASYEMTAEPIETDEIDGLNDAIEEVARTHQSRLVRCDDRVVDYDVYWNSTTETIRIAALAATASYEVPSEEYK